MRLAADATWSFRFAVRCASVTAHFAHGNTREVMDRNVRAKLALLGDVSRLETQAVDELLSDGYCGAVTLRPSAERDSADLGRAVLDGVNARRGAARAFYAPYTVADAVLLRTLASGFRGGAPGNVPFDIVRAPAPPDRTGAGAGPVTSRYTLGRVAGGVAGATDAETGEALAGAAVRAAALPTWALVVGATVGIVAVVGVLGYALRPVADLAEEL